MTLLAKFSLYYLDPYSLANTVIKSKGPGTHKTLKIGLQMAPLV